MRLRASLAVLCSHFLISCGLTPKEVKYNDEEIRPLWVAVENVNREALGFTPIDKNADIYLEGKSTLFDRPYDVMLPIYGKTSRTIAFRKISDDEFAWIGEQEIFGGPRKYETSDGEFNETIVLNYDVEWISGYAINQLIVVYRGPDEELTTKSNKWILTLSDIRPLIKDWSQQ